MPDPHVAIQLLTYALGAAMVTTVYFAYLLRQCSCEKCSFHINERAEARKKEAADSEKSTASEKGKGPPGGGWIV